MRYILNSFYTDKPDGLCGNNDCGQMSSWYVFSALGFYPVNPANSAFVFGSPLFDEASINLPNEEQFSIKVHNNSNKNIYIQSVKLNGNAYSRSFITYTDIMTGGTLEFEMGDNPNRKFGANPKERPEFIIN